MSSVAEAAAMVLSLQESRIKVYSNFHTAFDEYISIRERLSDNLQKQRDEKYQKVCEEITAEFSSISKSVIEIEEAVAGKDLARCIRNLQNAERDKLQLTVQAQLLQRQHWFEKTEDEQDETQLQFKKELAELNREIQNRITEINEALEDIQCCRLEEEE